MVKPPQTRHSKTRKRPVTIELEPGSVERLQEDMASDESAAEQAGAEVRLGLDEEAERATETVQPAERSATEQDENFEQSETGDQSMADHAAEAPRPAEGEEAEPSRAESWESTTTMPDMPQVAAPKAGSRGLTGLAAGILGGIVALAGAGALQYAGVLPPPGAEGDGSAAVSGMQADIASLKEQLTTVQAGNGGGDVKGLRQALGEQTSRADGLSATLDQVKADVAGLKSAIESGGAGENAGLKALDMKIADLEKAVAALGQGSSETPSAGIDDKLAAVQSALTAATSAASANNGRLGTMEKNLAAIEQSVTALTGKVEAQAAQPKVALAIAVSALKAAVEAGGSFASEVETFAAVAPNAPELADLRALSVKGVPSRAEIAAETPNAAAAMVDAARAVDGNAGVFERLVSSARTLVKIRPVGPVEGTGVPETVARIEAAVKDGDLARAVAEYETLPEAAKAAGQAFMEKVRARLAAEQLVETATAAALKAA
jgi:hypothetical protein